MDDPLACGDSDSSEDLPDLFKKMPFTIGELKKNDIVWALYKDLHWPAMVRSVDKKNKSVKVWYLDTPKKVFKLPFWKLHDFRDGEFSKQVREKAKSDPLSEKHSEVIKRSFIFLERKFRNIQDNPADFFDSTKEFYLVNKDFSFETPNPDLGGENATTENVGDDVDPEASSEGESLVDDKESCTIDKYLIELYDENRIHDDELSNKILNCIEAGHVDKHLVDITNSVIPSERHELYTKAEKTCNMQLLWCSPPSLPIKNHQKLHKISMYLIGLYERNFGKDKRKICEYVVSVWLPEAIDKAIVIIETEPPVPEAHDKAILTNETEKLHNDSPINNLSLEPELNVSSVQTSASHILESETFPVKKKCNVKKRGKSKSPRSQKKIRQSVKASLEKKPVSPSFDLNSNDMSRLRMNLRHSSVESNSNVLEPAKFSRRKQMSASSAELNTSNIPRLRINLRRASADHNFNASQPQKSSRRKHKLVPSTELNTNNTSRLRINLLYSGEINRSNELESAEASPKNNK